MDQILTTKKEGFKAIGVGDTKGRQLIGSGQIEAVTIGPRKTLLVVESLKKFAASRPPAEIAAPKSRKAGGS